MASKRSAALSAIILALGVALPELTIPASAVVPALPGAAAKPSSNLGSSKLLTEVGSRHCGDSNSYGHYACDDDYYDRHYSNYRVHLGGGGIALGYGDGYRVYLGDNPNGGDYRSRDYAYGGHVEWCLNRYRSYNPRTNTFMGYDGYRHRCKSPY
jgi:hypothetical protein